MSLLRKIRRYIQRKENAAITRDRRKLFLEPLEPRMLLSADLATAGVLGALDDGSDLLALKVGDFFAGDSQLDTRVPFVVESKINPADDFDVLATSPQLRDLLSVIVDVNRDGAILPGAEQNLDAYDADNDGKAELMEVLNPLLSQKLIADYQAGDGTPTMGEFLTYVNGLDTTISSGNYGFALQLSNAIDTSPDINDGKVSFSFDVSLTFDQDLAFDLGTIADDYAIGLGKEAVLHVTSSLAFNLEMGVFTSGETPANSDFFIEAGPLDFTFTVGGGGLTFPDLTIGFLGVSATGGTASVNAHILANLSDPTSAEKLGFTPAQFGAANAGSVTANTALDEADFDGYVSLFIHIDAGDTKEIRFDTTGKTTTTIITALQTELTNQFGTAITASNAGGYLKLKLNSGTNITVDSKVSYSDLNTQPAGTLLPAVFVDTPLASVNLPITVDSGIEYSASTSIDIGATDIRAVSPVLNDEGDLRFGLDFTRDAVFEEMLQFSNISAGSIIGLIRQLGSWFSSYENTIDYTSYKIPYTDATLSEVLDYADLLFDKLLIDDKDDGDDTTYQSPNLLKYENNSLVTNFATAQQLATKAGLSGAAYDTDEDRLTYNVSLNKIFTYELPVDFSLDLSPLMNIDSNVDINLTTNGGLAFVLGFDLGGPTVLDWDTALSDLNNGKGVSIKQEAAVTAPDTPTLTYGRLSGDAHFTITIGATDYDVILAREKTDTGTDKNDTVAHLADDINQAFDAAGLTGVTASAFGNKIRLQSTGAFTLTTTTSDPAYREIGFLETQLSDAGNTITAVKDAPVIVGMQSEDPLTTDAATFNIVVGSTTYNVSLDLKETVYNRTIVDLVNDVNKAITDADCTEVTVTSQGLTLVFSAAGAAPPASFSVQATNSAAENMGLGGTPLASNQTDFIIHVSNGIPSSYSIYLDGLDLDSDNDGFDDLGGIKTAIETQTGGKVTVEFNEALNGLRLVETGFNPAGSAFKVTAVNASPAALSLGILKSDVMPNSTDKKDGRIEGGPLGGTTLADRFFIQNANITAGISLTPGTSVEATARFGIVDIKLTGTPTLSATVNAGLIDAGNDGITLTELKSALGRGGDPSIVVAAPSISGSGNTNFTVTVDPAVLSLGGGNVSVNISNLGDPFHQTTYTGADGFTVKAGSSKIFMLDGDQTGTLAIGQIVTTALGSSQIVGLNYASGQTTVTLVDGILDGAVTGAVVNTPVAPATVVNISGLDNKLETFASLGMDNILSSLDTLVGFLEEMESFQIMGYELPLINRSMSDIVGYAAKFESALAGFKANPAASLQQLEGFLESALGGGNLITLSYVDDDVDMLKVALSDSIGFNKSMNIEIPELIPDLNLGPLGTMDVDLSGSAGLKATGSLGVTLALGLSLSTNKDAPTNLYVFEETGISADLLLAGNDLTFRAALGPVGLSISGGSVSLNPTFTLGLDKASTYFGSGTKDYTLLTNIFNSPIAADSIAKTLTGSLSANLPVFFPREENFAGYITLPTFDLSDLDLSLSDVSATIFTDLLNSLEYDDVLYEITHFDFSKFNIFDNMLLAVDGLSLFMEGLQGALESQIFGLLDLPVIGDALEDGARFLYDLQQDFIEPFRNLVSNSEDLARDFANPAKNVVSQYLYNILNPTGLLQSPSFSTSNPEYKGAYGGKVGLTTNLDDFLFTETGPEVDETFIQWNMTLGEEITFTKGMNFDLGIPGLGLDTRGDITVELGWDLDFAFGLSFADGFYIDLSDTNELSLWITALLPSGDSITGTLGFLSLTALVKDMNIDEVGDNDPTGAGAAFAIDLTNGGTNGRLGFTEVGNIDFNAMWAAQAQAGLGLTLGITGASSALPRVVADFAFDWGVPDSAINYADPEASTFVTLDLGSIGSAFSDGLNLVEFRDIQVDLGSFVGNVLGPIFEEIQTVTEPLQPFIDAITTPIPVISDLVGPTTLLDIAAFFGEVDPSLIYAIADVITLVNSFEASDGEFLIPLGSMTIYDAAEADQPDLWDGGLDITGYYNNLKDSGTLGNILSDPGVLSGALDLNSGSGDPSSASFVNKAKSLDTGGFVFPLFDDPSQIFGLLLGKDVVLVAYDMPPLYFEFEYSQFFTIFGPLGVSINGELFINADFAFGYDTYGIRNFVESDFKNVAALLDGFYVSDTDLPTGDYGSDVPELTFGGGLWAAAELNLGVAKAGVAGGIFVEVNFDLNDPDSDGRVRLAEMAGNIINQWEYGDKALAPLAVFDVYGSLYAKLFAFLEVDLFFFSIDEEWDITPEITILDFEIDFTRVPNLATDQGNGDLILNMGQFAADRLREDLSDSGETFTVTALDSDTVNVNAFGYDQEYDVSKTLIIKAGQGNDIVNLNLDALSPSVKIEIDGGPGDDIITLSAGTTAAAYITGGDGKDIITGGGGDDVIIGGIGEDELHGGGGMDLLFGDNVRLFDSSLTVRVNLLDGNDKLYGDGGRDILIGGGGEDELHGGDEGDAPGDVLIGDGATLVFNSPMTADNLAIGNIKETNRDLSGGNDLFYGDEGKDWIFGGRGDDIIWGGDHDDILFGESGTDAISGDAGNNLIYGDGGRPTDSNHNGKYDLYDQYGRLDLDFEMKPSGDGEVDFLLGGDNDDIIFGSGGNDIIGGGGGNDHLFGGSGADFLHGMTGDDKLYGQGDPDTLIGGAGRDYLDGGAGTDVLYGDLGPLSLKDKAASAIDWNEKVYGINTPDLYEFGETYSDEDPDGTDFDRDININYNDTLLTGIGSDFLDGQWGHDTYEIYLQGADKENIINVYDSGPSSYETDYMHVFGTMYDDNFLLRKSTSSSGLAFVALLNQEPYTERINYWSVEGGIGLERMLISGSFGKDHFSVDDVGTDTTLEGNEDDDSFQVGQLYNSPRDICASAYNHIEPEDVFATIETTVGWLSDGINRPMTVYGGTGEDWFTVFHNKAVLSLFGEDGDDTFLIKAFALAGSQEPVRERTDVSGGAGVDLVQYAMNAPVNIDGGDGFDRLIVIGTEFGDDIVVTKDGVYGMGLNVNFVNIESLAIDGAEGDDRFYVMSTGESFITELYGGLGSDTFNISGDTPPIISNDLKGHSGVITHEIENTEIITNYTGIPIEGIAANVADNDTEDPVVVISTPLGMAEIMEGDYLQYYYEILLSTAPLAPVSVQVYAPLQTQDQEDRKSKLFGLSSPTEVPGSVTEDRTAIALEFDAANWSIPQKVYISAIDSSDPNFTDPGWLENIILPLDPDEADLVKAGLDYDDDAIEGDKTGFINHVVTTQTGIKGQPDHVWKEEQPDKSYITFFKDYDQTFVYDSLDTTNAPLVGYMLQITDGPGAGQSMRIIGVQSDTTLMLAGEFRECAGSLVGNESTYKISRDIEANRAVEVLVYDNDIADVIAAETGGSTVLFEYNEGDTAKDDTISVRLAREPESAVTVTLASNDSQLSFSASTLTFTTGNWSTPQDVTVTAVNDIVREGFHHGLITFTSSSVDIDTQKTVEEEVILDVEQAYSPLLNRPAFKINGITPDVEYVKLNGQEQTYGTDYQVYYNKIVFLTPEGDYRKVIGKVEVKYTFNYAGYDEMDIRPVLTDIADNDVAQVMITQTAASTDVIEGWSSLDGVPYSDTYGVVLTQAPTDDVQIRVTPEITKTSAGRSIHWGQQVAVMSEEVDAVKDGNDVLLTFTPDNWFEPQEVIVYASYEIYGYDSEGNPLYVDDDWYDGDDTQYIAPQLHTVSDIQGPLYIRGAGGNGSILSFQPAMLHYELNMMPSTDEIIEIGEAGDTITVDKETLLDAAAILERMDEITLADLVARKMTITLSEGIRGYSEMDYDNDGQKDPIFMDSIGQFRLIIAAVDNGDDTATLTLNEPWELAEGETLDMITKYRITHMSENFFANEAEQIDYVFVYNEESPADNEIDSRQGWLKDSTTIGFEGNGIVAEFATELEGKWLYGFGMATQDLKLGGTFHPRGVTYGEMEVVEINLGYGNDIFNIEDTQVRPDGYQTWTIVNTGGGDDIVNADLDAEEDLLDAQLVVDISIPATSTTLPGDFSEFGTGGLVGYTIAIKNEGGSSIRRMIIANTETELTVISSWDQELNETATYFIYDDQLTNPPTVLSSSLGVIPANADTLMGDFSSFGANALRGRLIEIYDGAGAGTTREIIANTDTEITVNETWNSVLDDTTMYRILGDLDGPIAINAESGNDKVYGSASTRQLIVFGGDGDDIIYGGSGEDIIFGDKGRVEYRNEDGKIITLLGSVRTRIDPQYVTAAAVTSLSDSTATFPVETIDSRGLSGLMVSITDGRGFRQGPRLITSNDVNTLYNELEGDGWDPIPKADPNGPFNPIDPDNNPSKYRISLIPEDQTDGVVRDPLLLIAVEPETGGNDSITGGFGNDRIFGGAGDDDIWGSTGNDVLFGDLGRMDYVAEDVGEDGPLAGQEITASLWRVRTTYESYGGADTLYGLAGEDILLGGFNPADSFDTLLGGNDDDVLLGDNGLLTFAPNLATIEDLRDVYLVTLDTIYPGIGGSDDLRGNAGNDLVVGGTDADQLYGDDKSGSAGANDGDDILIGDNASVEMVGGVAGRFNAFDSGVGTIETTDTEEATGGADVIGGNANLDILFGGVGGDTLYGDAADEEAHDLADVIVGDNGYISFVEDAAKDPTTVELIETRDVHLGGIDEIYGNDGDDIIFGGKYGDTIRGNRHDDLIFGDFGRMVFVGPATATAEETYDKVFFGSIARVAEITDNNEGGNDTIFGDADEDILIGGAGSDRIDGGSEDDIIFGDNVSLTRTGAAYEDDTNPRYRTLTGSTNYGETPGVNDGETLENSTHRLIPDLTGTPVWQDWDIELLDHNITIADSTDSGDINKYGNDYIAGGGHDDTIFGQLGDDVIQGDGSIDLEANLYRIDPVSGAFVEFDFDEAPVGIPEGTDAGAWRSDSDGLLYVRPSVEASSDGDDYIEGNGGADVIFGGLGQDDIVGDNSSLFSLLDYDERLPAGSDLIFGGAGTDIARNDSGDASVDAGGNLSAVDHARDADMILGDNGNIYRLVRVAGTDGDPKKDETAYLEFTYDQSSVYEDRGTLRIIPRAAELLDYTPGGPDYDPAGAATDIGFGDEIHGESGDDSIYGMVGSDVLFGEGQDDDLIGGYGNDWISGGTGDDGILGDDGRIYTSRNSSTDGESLYGIAPLLGNDPNAKFNNGNVLNEIIYTPGKIQQSIINISGQLKKTVNLTPFSVDPGWNANDDEFGDSGTKPRNSDDIIYGGLGNDSLHGGAGDDAVSGAEALTSAFIDGGKYPSYDKPYDAVNVLGYDASKTTFEMYDEYDPLLKIAGFLLNFDETEGILRPSEVVPTNGQNTIITPDVNDDGSDVIFGDLGNDWLVGGTGRDHLYGGWGNDLLNADDDLTTNSGANDAPDTHSTYEDIAYGGAGRDVLIGNTGGDRLIDWAGEFNSYLVPFAPFGMATVSRTLQPQLPEYLYALSMSDGIDMTRAADTGAEAARNGEPYGELGLVKQKDFAWHEQTGAPRDPQAGNIPGGKRDVLRSAGFDSNQMNQEGFYTASGVFTVQNGRLIVAAESLGGDAAAVFHLNESLPQYYEIQATINAVKPTAGWKANAYIIFDYQNEYDFKFAGINVSLDKIQMGRRTQDGWIVDVQSNVKVKPGIDYNVLLAVNGTAVTLVVDNQTYFSYTFAPRVDEYGYVYALNTGMVGFGSDNSRGTFDNLAVQVLPPEITFEGTEEFSDTDPVINVAAAAGEWQSDDVRYEGTPINGDPAISLLDLAGLEGGLEASSILGLKTTLNTAKTAGVVFDYYGADNFKYASINAETDELIIGHYTQRGGWAADAVVSTAIEAGVDYELDLSLKGTTVNASVKVAESTAPGYQAMAGYVFNAVTVDGGFGLLARYGSGSFDDVAIKTNDAALSYNHLNYAALDPIIAEAVSRWTIALDLDEATVAALSSVNFVITDLAGDSLGMVLGDTIYIDIDAAGYDWFIDSTPWDDAEFILQDGALVADASSVAYDDIDLLTVVMHELGHILGYEDLDPAAAPDDVMTETLETGERHLMDDSLVALDADAETVESFLTAETLESEWLADYLESGAESAYDPNAGIAIVLTKPEETVAAPPAEDTAIASSGKAVGKKK